MTKFSIVMLRRLREDLVELHPDRKQEIDDALRLAAVGLAVHTYLEHRLGAFGWAVTTHMQGDGMRSGFGDDRNTSLWHAVRDGYSFILEL